jgi:hypothetical protein
MLLVHLVSRCKIRSMRQTFALPCCVAFLGSFVPAPFQQVHSSDVHGGHHDHAPLVHSHFSAHGHSHHDHIDKPGEREIESPDDDQAFPLDTFTLVVTPDFGPFVPAHAPGIVEPPAETRESFELIEERGHDPPSRRSASPRAPPARILPRTVVVCPATLQRWCGLDHSRNWESGRISVNRGKPRRSPGKLALLLIIGFDFKGQCRAQLKLGLEDAINQALQSRMSLKAENERVFAARGLEKQASLRPNPELLFQNENLRPGQTYSRGVDTVVYVTQALDMAGKRTRRIAVAQDVIERTQASMNSPEHNSLTR